MRRSGAVQWSIRALGSVLALAGAVPAFAQSCPMCYNAAASTKASAIQALRSGTLILIFPVLFIFAGILIVLYRSRNRFNEIGIDSGLAAAPNAGGWAHLADGEGLKATGHAPAPESSGHEHTLPYEVCHPERSEGSPEE